MQLLAQSDHHRVLHVLAILLRIVIWEVVGSFSEPVIAAAILEYVVSDAGIERCGGGADAIGFIARVAERCAVTGFGVDEVLSLLERGSVL
jgi:hypothetical protein